jgi:succinoglycan biosynthesis transport protein ExoP
VSNERPGHRSGGRPLGSLVRSLALVLVLALIGAVVGYALGSRKADQYTARASVLVSALAGNPYSTDGQGDSLVNLETEAQLVQSDTVASAVANRLGLATPTGLLSGLSVAVPANTQILTIEYTAGSRGDANRRAQAFADTYLDFRSQRASKVTDARAARIQDQIDTQNQALTALVQKQDREIVAVRKAVIQEQIDGATTQIGQLRTALTSLQTGQVDPGQVITPAHIVSRSPITLRLLSTIAGFLVGLAIAVLILVLAARSRSSISDPDDVTAAGLPLLGTVPMRELAETTNAIADPEQGDVPVGAGLRELRVALLARDRRRPLRLLLTTAPGAGAQSHTALGLAQATARADLTTVLVDAIGGATGISETLGLGENRGFSEVLAHGLEVERALTRRGDHLLVLAAGHADAHAEDLLISPRMTTMLEELGKLADIVLVAAGPVNEASARALAVSVDGVVVEAMQGRTRAGDLVALSEESSQSEPVTGVVYIDTTRRRRQPASARGR